MKSGGGRASGHGRRVWCVSEVTSTQKSQRQEYLGNRHNQGGPRHVGTTSRSHNLTPWAGQQFKIDGVAGSIPDGVIGTFHCHNPSGRTMALGSNQPLTEMSKVKVKESRYIPGVTQRVPGS
jgi:hypothetical protein